MLWSPAEKYLVQTGVIRGQKREVRKGFLYQISALWGPGHAYALFWVPVDQGAGMDELKSSDECQLKNKQSVHGSVTDHKVKQEVQTRSGRGITEQEFREPSSWVLAPAITEMPATIFKHWTYCPGHLLGAE